MVVTSLSDPRSGEGTGFGRAGVIDVGEVKSGCSAHFVVPLSAESSAPPRWDFRPRKSGFVADFDGESLVVTVPTHGVGKRVARLVVHDDGLVREVLVSALLVGSVGGWPEAVHVDDARRLLTDWAAHRPLVPNWLYAGQLQVREANIVRATVVAQCESVRQETRIMPSLPDLPMSACGGARIELDLNGWEKSSGEEVLTETITERTCGSCDEAHQGPCPECGATGTITCQTSVPCPACAGLGERVSMLRLAANWLQAGQPGNADPNGDTSTSRTIRAFAGRNDYVRQCTSCQGTGWTVCSHCGGSGQRPCPTCVHGRAPCSVCGGDGIVVEFVTAIRTRTLTQLSKLSEGSDLPTSEWENEFRPLATAVDDLLANVPEGHAALRRWVEDRAGERLAHEVVRRVWLDVLPVTAVEYTEGQVTRTAFLIGEGREVFAPGAARPSRGRITQRFVRLREGRSSRHKPGPAQHVTAGRKAQHHGHSASEEELTWLAKIMVAAWEAGRRKTSSKGN